MSKYLVVGAGFAGSTFARLAAEDGHEVLVIDKRKHFGGNAYDEFNSAGIRYHLYGPHIFHTNSSDVWDFLGQFTEWHAYEHRVKAMVRGTLVPLPINLETIQTLLDPTANEVNAQEILYEHADHTGRIPNAENAVISKVGRHLYDCLFRDYTEKMWGMPASQLSAQVTNRIPVRLDYEDRYFTDKYQAIPRPGYANMFNNLLDHPNILLELDMPYNQSLARHVDLVCWTGPIDEYFDYRHGHLPYRSMRFEHINVPSKQVLPVATINYPGKEHHTRITEIKQITGQESAWSTITIEYPQAEGDPYYPILSPVYQEVARRYRLLADDPSVRRNAIFIGRLGSYQYYNMDQVVAQAMHAYRSVSMGEKQVLA